MRIYQTIRFSGEIRSIDEKALIDTGASISMIPLQTALAIGAWKAIDAWNMPQTMNIIGVHGQRRTLPLGIAYVYFPSLNEIGGQFRIAVSDIEQESIIGMDILNPLGITIDTGNRQLSVKKETWEAFKTLSGIAGVGVLIFAGIKALDSIFVEER